MSKQQQKYGLDGFTLRRRSSETISRENKSGLARPALPNQFLRPSGAALARSEETAPTDRLPRPQLNQSDVSPHRLQANQAPKPTLSRFEIDESLRSVDEEVTTGKKSRGDKTKKPFRKVSGRKIKKKWIFLAIGLIILGFIGYFVIKFILAGSNIFSGNLFDLFGSGVELKKDQNGRSNILIFGTSEDDSGHAGAELTDSIMVLSIDQAKKTAAMISMPRDFWVDYNKACISGYSGKINVVYMCNAEDGNVAAGSKALQEKVGEVFGMDIQYYTKINYTVVRELTSALGGVTVNIESSDPRGIYDYNTRLRLPNGPATLQGEQALAFVRARGDGGGYGFDGSNFAREQNQQKMIIALRDKSLSAGTLANPVAVNGMLDALGSNIQTNFSAAEVKTLTKLAEQISGNQVRSISLVDKNNPVVTTGSYSGQSIVRPIAGMGDYSKIKAYISQQLSGGSFEGENPSVEILNASTTVGLAAKKKTKLEEAGFYSITTGDAASTIQTPIVWYDTTKGAKPKSQAKLSSVLGKQPSGATLPNGISSNADFVILLGNE